MINMINDHLRIDSVVGQNGRIWIKTPDVRKLRLAIRAFRMIESQAHTSNLTDRVNKMLTEALAELEESEPTEEEDLDVEVIETEELEEEELVDDPEDTDSLESEPEPIVEIEAETESEPESEAATEEEEVEEIVESESSADDEIDDSKTEEVNE